MDVTIDKAKNVICKIGCEEHEDYITFAAHTDIVFPDMETLPMREEDGKLYAPGIGDDTSNLVNLLMGAKYLLQNKIKLKYGVLIVCNACEEGLGNLDGTKELFAAYGSRIKAFYSFDGYTPQCCSTAVGSYRYKISCRTTGGHSYINFGEPNAFTRQSADIISNFYTGDIDFAAYSTDSNVPLSLGIAANTIGTVLGALAHTREEWIDISSLPKGLGIVLSLMLLYEKG